eukprot:3682785-Pleurochrysis_carterae.AAC.2
MLLSCARQMSAGWAPLSKQQLRDCVAEACHTDMRGVESMAKTCGELSCKWAYLPSSRTRETTQCARTEFEPCGAASPYRHPSA